MTRTIEQRRKKGQRNEKDDYIKDATVARCLGEAAPHVLCKAVFCGAVSPRQPKSLLNSLFGRAHPILDRAVRFEFPPARSLSTLPAVFVD